MIRLRADEDFRFPIVEALRKMVPELDLVTVQAAGFQGRPDPWLLEWAAAAGRMILTHDRKTMTRFAYGRAAAGSPMAGIIVIGWNTPIYAAAESVALLVRCSLDGEWDGEVIFLPL